MCICSNCGNLTSLSKGEKGDPGATGASGLALMPPIDVTGSTKVLTSSDTGSLVLLDRSAGITVTLPSSPPEGTNFTFQVKTAAGAGTYVINVGTDGTAVMNGFIFAKKSATDDAIFSTTTGVTFTMNSDTKGGLVGAKVFMVYGSNTWNVSGQTYGSGVLATPFS